MSDNSLLEKLETFYIRFREIGQLITDPEVIQDMNRFVKLNKEYRDLEQIVEAGDELKRAVSSYDEAQEILNTETDKELKEMAEMDLESIMRWKRKKYRYFIQIPRKNLLIFRKFNGIKKESMILCCM